MSNTKESYTYEFYVPEYGGTPENFETFIGSYLDLNLVLDELCHKYFPDDWGYETPSEIFIKRVWNQEWKRFSIEMESVPAFYVTEKQ